MKKIVTHKLGSETVEIEISTHDDFVKCIIDTPSPFKHGKTALNTDVDITKLKSVVIKCSINELEQRKFVNISTSAQMVFQEILPTFREDTWPDDVLVEVETYFCNRFEEQFKYIFTKPEKA